MIERLQGELAIALSFERSWRKRAEAAEAEIERLKSLLFERLKADLSMARADRDSFQQVFKQAEAEVERLKRELDGANIGMQIREKALEVAEARLAKVVEILSDPMRQPVRRVEDALAAAQQKEA